MKTIVQCLAILSILFLTVGLASAQQTITTGDAAVPITDSGGALTECQTVIAATEAITDLNVQVSISHSWVGDLTVRLEHPDTTAVTLFNRPGGTGTGAGDSSDLDGVLISFSDSMPTDAETMGSAGTSLHVICTDDALCEYFPNPDPTSTPIGGVGTNLADFNGKDAAGTWTLCVGDQAGGDTGTLLSWTLAVNAAVPVELQSYSIE